MAESIHIKADGSWVFDGEDSRLKRDREAKQVTYRIWNALEKRFEYQTMDKVYCMNCGADGGYSARIAWMVKYLCDLCYAKQPKDGSFIPMLPEEEAAWRMGLKEPSR